jgi:hypothetical protein
MTAAAFKATQNSGSAPAISYVQTTNTALSGAAPASVNVSFPSQPKNGNFVVVKVLQSHTSTPSITSVTDNNGNTYSSACTQTAGGPTGRASLYYSKLTSVATSPFTITIAGTSNKWTANAQEYSGLTTVDVSMGNGAGATSNPWSDFMPQTSTPNTLLSAVMLFGGTFNSISTNSFTNRLLNSNATYAIGSGDDMIVDYSTVFYTDWWTDTSNNFLSCMAAFK